MKTKYRVERNWNEKQGSPNAWIIIDEHGNYNPDNGFSSKKRAIEALKNKVG